jgi:hypothetical protein
MSKIEPLAEDDNKEMRDFALLIALDKFQICSYIYQSMQAGIDRIEGYQKAWNSYANDPTLDKLKGDLRKLGNSLPRGYYPESFRESLGGGEPGDFDYGRPGDEMELRYRDAGVPYESSKGDGVPYDIPFVEPIEMFKRKKAEIENGQQATKEA